MKLMYNNQGAYYGRNMGRWLWDAGKPGLDPKEPFYVENTYPSEESYVSIRKTDDRAPTITVEYSWDKITWQSLGSTSTNALIITIPAGSKVWLRANANSWSSENWGYYYGHQIAGVNYFLYAIGGNIMSLLYGSNFTGNEKQFPDSSTSGIFYQIFSGYDSSGKGRLTDVSKLILPATTLVRGCYYSMFQGRNALTTAPALPAVTLAPSCYSNMFFGCTGLTEAPALPATTLAQACYQYMFHGCTGLTEAPALPAATLVGNCYEQMFQGCTGLTEVSGLKFEDFGGSGSCKNMFNNCSNLNYIKCLAINPSETFNNFWMDGVAATGTFVKKAGVTWPSGAAGIPSGWTVIEE